MEEYSFANSSALDFPVNVRIGSLEGQYEPPSFSTLLRRPDLRHVGSNTSPNSDLYVTAQLWAGSKPLTVPVQTAYRSFKIGRTWNEWLELPIKISTLPLSSQLAITVWDLSPTGGKGAHGHAIPFGGTTISLFDKDSTLQKGRQKCRLYRHEAADGFSSTTTPAIPSAQRNRGGNGFRNGNSASPEGEELERLEKLFKKHEMGEIPRVDWLDKLVFTAVEKQRQLVETSARVSSKATRKLSTPRPEVESNDANSGEDGKEEERYTLLIDFPRFDFPIVYTDHEYAPPTISSQAHHAPPTGNVTLKPPPEVQLGPGINGTGNGVSDDDENSPPLIRIYDPEVGAKDNPAESKHRRLVRSHRTGVLDRDLKPNAKIRDELNTIVSYGPTQELNAEEKDLVWKFRHHLTRDKRALTKFVKSVAWHDQSEARQAVQLLPKWTEIDVDDALELLGPTFDNAAVRAYAVDRLRESDDDELLLYLLQLVQALKFEKISPELQNDSTQDSSLARFLISRATRNLMLGNFLHWYLMVECDDRSPDQVKEHRKLFAKVEFDFMTELMKIPEGAERRKTLLRQGELITVLSKISKEIRFSREDRPRKLQRLKKYLADPKNELTSFDPPLPLPLDPSISIVGCHPEESLVFKSSLYPLLIHFKTPDGKKYPIIFKTGDDLRQDQLVIQIISLMDRLLRKENLDLKLSPYRILATSANAGVVQFVPSMSLAAASAKYKGSILAYLRANNPDTTADLGVRPSTMDIYVKSCAGYCVITYLLGVGDRHLDNLLLAPSGHFFHADFGYILGRDPKPFAPQMKLCKEMVEGMGSSTSPHYAAFKSYCFTAYTTLRKSSNLILNLFSLMVDANIPDIKVEPERVVEKVRERFHLEMSEEEAMRHFEGLIVDSVGSIFPVVIDTIHNMMQGLRA
ncbi:MAG: Phosphatidylinositol (PI) 3-kinase [Alectoria fallacina]|uniref:Phosphatidylinositol 3-kinase VPS34 n=1 Tax=Alectoria fallacina TaxID=1903189 RepID=A0A8H3PKZ4_9LECA|nr:MAG: Phosphatidylinositol (PI) 3-kinase [Alectoria fallacina]